jgi:hypothetical protein
MRSTRVLATFLTGLAVAVVIPSALAAVRAPSAHARVVKQNRFTRASRAGLRADGIDGSLTLRGSVGQATFYTATSSTGRTCYLIGKTADTIATTFCPSAGEPDALGGGRPVLDAAFFVAPHLQLDQGALIGFFGFATAEVDEVDLVASDGSRVPVPFHDGLFAAPSPRPDATGVVALDATGKVVYRETFPS